MSDMRTRRTTGSRFWGRTVNLKLPARIVSLVFVVVAIAAMSFCQLGFWPLGVIDGKLVYLMLLLAPLVMAAITLLAILLIAAVSVLATVLLNRVLDYGAGLLSYVNAGHNPPLLLHDGKWEWVKDVSGMPLGLFDGIPYNRFERQLAIGNMLYAYTDGVTEAMDAGGNLFGEERLEETLYRYADFNPRSVGVGVRRALTDYTLDAEQSDDITMLVLKYGVPPEKRAVMVLPADVKQLVHVCNFIHEELKRRHAPKSVYSPLDIASEEFFVNVRHYAYPDATPENPGEVRIGFEYEANPPVITVTISDDGIPFDPLVKPDAVTPDDISDVPIGGLGILMAKRSVDEMSYERVGDSNVLTFSKGW